MSEKCIAVVEILHLKQRSYHSTTATLIRLQPHLTSKDTKQMREYILTKKERCILNRYIESGEKLEGFTVLLHRCRNMEPIEADVKLIKQFLEKAQVK